MTADGTASAEFDDRNGRITCDKKLTDRELASASEIAREIDAWAGPSRLPSEYAGYADAPELVLLGTDVGRRSAALALVMPANTQRRPAARPFMRIWRRATKLLPKCNGVAFRPKFVR